MRSIKHERGQLNRLLKQNGTKTARAIVRARYPLGVRMNITADDIKPDFRQGIQEGSTRK